MPCRDYTAEDEWRQRQDREQEEALRESRKTIDQMTRMLCSVCKIVEMTHDDDSALPHNAKVWWEEHKAQDAIREKKARRSATKKKKQKAEKIRKMELAETALAKLSSEEIKALGL